jgi:voltage-gated potassium channel Kch
MAACVVVHASGVTWALGRLRRAGIGAQTLWRSTRMCVLLAAFMILCHSLEIAIWAAIYAWRGAMPDLQSSLYFSAVTYTTTGYGDLVLAPEWRLVGGIEALTGILMCGLSTGFFFAVVSRMTAEQAR